MKSFFNIIKKVEMWLLVALMISFTSISFLQVIFRLVLKDPLAWSEEASRYLFVWATFLGSAIVLSKYEHFNIDFIIGIFPKRFQKIFNYFAYTCIGVFSFIVVKYGIELQKSASTQFTPALDLKMSTVYSIIPISGILMLIHLFEFIYKDISRQKETL